jgi:hypothetical protein
MVADGSGIIYLQRRRVRQWRPRLAHCQGLRVPRAGARAVASQARLHLPSLLTPARWVAQAKARGLVEPTRVPVSLQLLICLRQKHNIFTLISTHG